MFNAAQDSAYIAAVTRAYVNMGLREVERVHSMPFSAITDKPDATSNLPEA